MPPHAQPSPAEPLSAQPPGAPPPEPAGPPLDPCPPAGPAHGSPLTMPADGTAEGRAPPPDPAAERARRARENGAKSRGPVTAAGKARSSRNALKHGLTAEVHLVLPREDGAAFTALAEGLFAELAPTGILDGSLVAHLAAALWKVGRAERLEAQAFHKGPTPDPDRLRLALRYQGSNRVTLFRCLRELRDLRAHPLATGATPPPATSSTDAASADAGPVTPPEPASLSPGPSLPEAAPTPDTPPFSTPASPATSPRPDLAAPGLAAIALAAWGGQRPFIPPGCLMLRPVPDIAPLYWRAYQDRAFPGDEPVAVDAEGRVHAPPERLRELGLLAPPTPEPTGLRHGLTPTALAGPASPRLPEPAAQSRSHSTPNGLAPDRMAASLRNEPTLPNESATMPAQNEPSHPAEPPPTDASATAALTARPVPASRERADPASSATARAEPASEPSAPTPSAPEATPQAGPHRPAARPATAIDLWCRLWGIAPTPDLPDPDDAAPEPSEPDRSAGRAEAPHDPADATAPNRLPGRADDAPAPGPARIVARRLRRLAAARHAGRQAGTAGAQARPAGEPEALLPVAYGSGRHGGGTPGSRPIAPEPVRGAIEQGEGAIELPKIGLATLLDRGGHVPGRAGPYGEIAVIDDEADDQGGEGGIDSRLHGGAPLVEPA